MPLHFTRMALLKFQIRFSNRSLGLAGKLRISNFKLQTSNDSLFYKQGF